MKFIKAMRRFAWLKLAITGPAGSVKTLGAIFLASGLGKKIAFVDTENGSASLYSSRCDFDVLTLKPPFTQSQLIEAIKLAVDSGYEILIIDSYSHFWEETMDQKAVVDAKGGSSYTTWRTFGKRFGATLNAILQAPLHTIICMRSKMDYVLETDIRGKQVPRKVGLAPVMRPEIEYEFTLILDGDAEHFVTASKDRTGLFVDQRFQITPETGEKLLDWLNDAPPPDPEPGPVTELAAAVSGIDPKLVQAFYAYRGFQDSVPEDYAIRALKALPRFRQSIEQFRQNGAPPETATAPQADTTKVEPASQKETER